MAEDKNIKDKKPKVDSAAAPAKDAKQEGGIKKKIKVKKKEKKNVVNGCSRKSIRAWIKKYYS